MTTVSTSLSSIPASVIQIRLLYGYGNANENRSLFHYANKQVPSLEVTFSAIEINPNSGFIDAAIALGGARLIAKAVT